MSTEEANSTPCLRSLKTLDTFSAMFYASSPLHKHGEARKYCIFNNDFFIISLELHELRLYLSYIISWIFIRVIYLLINKRVVE